MQDWIWQEIKARSRRNALFWGCVLGAMLGVVAFHHRYASDLLLGPCTQTASNLAAIQDIATAPHTFVTVAGSRLIDTGINEVTEHAPGTQRAYRSTTGTIRILDMDGRLLVVKTSSTEPTPHTAAAAAPHSITGELKPMRDDMRALFIEAPEMAGLRDRVFPFYLDDDETAFRSAGLIAVALALWCLFVCRKELRRTWQQWRDPSTHPVLQRLATWGPPAEVARAIQQAATSPRWNSGGWRVTEDYLVQSTDLAFDVLRMQDLVWAYKQVTKHSINLIPTGKTREAVFVCRDGTACIQGTEATVDALLAFAVERAPLGGVRAHGGAEAQLRAAGGGLLCSGRAAQAGADDRIGLIRRPAAAGTRPAARATAPPAQRPPCR